MLAIFSACLPSLFYKGSYLVGGAHEKKGKKIPLPIAVNPHVPGSVQVQLDSLFAPTDVA